MSDLSTATRRNLWKQGAVRARTSAERGQTTAGVDRSSRLRTRRSETLRGRRRASISGCGDVERRRRTRVATAISSQHRICTRVLCSGIDVVATQAGGARGRALRLRVAAAPARAWADGFVRALLRRDAKGPRERRARRFRRAFCDERCEISRTSSLPLAGISQTRARVCVRVYRRDRGRRRVGHQRPSEQPPAGARGAFKPAASDAWRDHARARDG